VFAGGVKKEAWAAARRWLKNTQDPNGAWFGVRVTLTIDGKRVSNKVIAANYHPGKE
jgi:squalene cyclase